MPFHVKNKAYSTNLKKGIKLFFLNANKGYLNYMVFIQLVFSQVT